MRLATARRVPRPQKFSSLPNQGDTPKLKKLINKVVQELAFLGFSPEVVRDLVKQGDDVLHAVMERHSSEGQTIDMIRSQTVTSSSLRLLYEVDNDFGHLAPHLRFIIDKDTNMDTTVSATHTAKTRILTREVKPCVPISASLRNSPADS